MNSIVIFLGCLGITFSLAQTQPTPFSGYDLKPDVGDDKTFENFVQVLKTSSATSIDDFLVDWKSTDPLIFRYYLLAYRSRSLQGATPEFPRAIVFYPTGEFAASFNGHPKQKGYQQIELYRFNYQKNNFEFYELSFRENEKPTLSEPNPQKCLDCHQSLGRETPDPRPNWEPYFFWPGFYGSVSGVFKTKLSKLTDNEADKIHVDKDALLLKEIPYEQKWYSQFMGIIRPNHPRYKVLEPYNKDQALVDAKIYGSHSAADLKTLMYTQRAAQLNFRRVARLMQEDEEVFEYLKEAIVALLNCSSNKLPTDFAKWLFENSSFKGQGRTRPHVLNMGDQIRLLFEPFYFNTDDWSMDFKTDGRFAFSNRFGTPGRPHIELLLAINSLSPTMAKASSLSCRDPEFVRSLEKYYDLRTAIRLQEKRSGNKEKFEKLKNAPLINRCISCHASPSSRDVPHIPFDNPSELKKLLFEVKYKQGTLLDEIIYRTGAHANSDEQMPPRGIPTQKQRDDMISYLKSL